MITKTEEVDVYKTINTILEYDEIDKTVNELATGWKYNDGEISLNNIREIYKSWNEVYNNYEWFRKINGESPITIGEIIDIDK